MHMTIVPPPYREGNRCFRQIRPPLGRGKVKPRLEFGRLNLLLELE